MKKFTLDFLGTGSAFTVGENFQSNILMTAPSGKRMLFDCGGDVRFPLHQRGLSFKDIDAIYISHLHADHVGGLEGVAFGTHWIPNHPKPKLITSANLVNKLWNNSLSAGLESLEGEYADLSTYFDVQAVGKAGKFTWEGVEFQLVQVVHIMSAFSIMPSYGLLFKLGETTVFFTSDTQFCPHQIMKFYNMSDLILHDCETSPFPSGVHSHFNFLKTLPSSVKAKMWLYHYQPGDKPDAEAEGFRGYVEPRQVFEFQPSN